MMISAAAGLRYEAATSVSRPAAHALAVSLLVASDGSPASEAAVRVSAALAHHLNTVPCVLSVLPPLLQPLIAPETFAPDSSSAARARKRRTLVEQQIHVASGVQWPITVDDGDPAARILARATQMAASLIVMGLRPHQTLDRIFRDETTLRVMRSGVIPVLGVTESLSTIPRRILVAVDFSPASLCAARAALALAAPDATVFFACVRPAGAGPEYLEGANSIVTHGIAAVFGRVVNELAPSLAIRFEQGQLEGEPAAELLSFADRTGADLIAIGCHRRAPLSRKLLGNVTYTVVRDARCSVLVTGPRPTPSSAN